MIELRPSYTSRGILRAIERYDTVSFDIFDTLVKRAFASPRDLFARAARDAARQTGREIDPEAFRRQRIEAAAAAKEAARLAGREEVTLEEIYARLPQPLAQDAPALMQAETAREIACCRPNPVVKAAYERCREAGKRIFIISDMYLPRPVVEEILRSCGYAGYEKLYLSSDIGVKKQTGRLFAFALRDAGLDPKRHIHVGDHPRTDYLAAIRSGIHAYKLPTDAAWGRFNRIDRRTGATEAYRKLQTLVGNHSDPGEDGHYKYGFEVVGPALVGFITWLHGRLVEGGYRKVFFLARDGYLMQRAYGALYGDQAVENGYLYVSRKSLLPPQLWLNPTLADILDPETPYRYWSCEEFCGLLGIDPDAGAAQWARLGLGPEERLSKAQLLGDERVARFFALFQGEIIDRSKRAFDTVVAYLKQEGFAGRVAIVDIGWAGATQKYLDKYIEKSDIDATVYGYYFGVKQRTVMGERAESFIPRAQKTPLFCSQLIEYPFTKRVGTTVGYAPDPQGRIAPVLADYEFADLPDSGYTGQMQRGIEAFVALVAAGYGPIPADWSVAYGRLRQVTKRPSLAEVRLLGGLAHVNQGHTSRLARPRSPAHYLAHPRDLKVDFSFSGWKVGFLKKMFKLPLPYNWLLEKVRGADK